MDNAKLACSLPVGFAATSMAASPLAHLVVVGTANGHLYICDLNKLDNPRIIHHVHMHQGPVKHIVLVLLCNLPMPHMTILIITLCWNDLLCHV